MNEQNLALELAEALEKGHASGMFNWQILKNSADELRRQHAQLEQWKEKAIAWTASPEAAQRLDGYRELAQLAYNSKAEYDELMQKYHDLVMCVGNKYPGESRHDTAKRYLLNAELLANTADSGSQGKNSESR